MAIFRLAFITALILSLPASASVVQAPDLFEREQNQAREHLERHRQAIREYLPQLLREQRELEALPLFQTSRRRDLGPLLLSELGLDGSPEANQQLRDRLEAWRARYLSHPDFKQRFGPDWFRHARQLPYHELELEWLSRMGDADHLNLAELPANQRRLAASPLNDDELMSPDVVTLVGLARLRLMQGLAQGRPLPALREARQLAKILVSQAPGHSLWFIWAQSLLEAEALTFEQARSQKLDLAGWTPIGPELREQIRRVSLARRGLFSYQTPPEVLRQVFTPGSLGLCGILADESQINLLMYPFLAADFEPAYDVLTGLVREQAAGCGAGHLLELWQDPVATVRANLGDNVFGTVSGRSDQTLDWAELQQQPALRRYLGAVLANVAYPDWASGYRR